ncbi:hypothetical protein [Streptomyces sp. Da 82-17]|uniref:hypothetical protein n=1 Tax=Streptomyces sp. Da 82-17 TaxID=3377116 RepID=UPI0038D50814
MSRWDADQQRWLPGPTQSGGGGGGAVARRRQLAVGAALAVVLVGGVGFGAWALVKDGGPLDGAGQSPQVPTGPATLPSDGYASGGTTGTASGGASDFPTAPSEPDPDTSDTDTDTGTDAGTGGDPDTGTAPAGYERVDDPAGFRIDVPEGWQRSEQSDGIFYKSSDGASLLQIFVLEGPETTPYESLTATERQVSQNPGYQRIALDRLEGDAAQLDYAYDHDEFGRRRVIDVAFTGADGVQYAILVAGPESDWPVQHEHETAALKAFCPADHC